MRIITISSQEIERVNKAALVIEERMRDPLTISRLAARVKLSEIKLKLGFKQVYGIAPYAYLLVVRMKKAKAMLLAEEPIKAIAMTIGYKTESNFCKAFKNMHKETPRSWMKKQLQETG